MGQFELVRDALRERKHLLHIAPHLSRAIPIIVPFYYDFPQVIPMRRLGLAWLGSDQRKRAVRLIDCLYPVCVWHQILFYAPYYWIGIKMYDWFAGSEGLLEPSYYISRRDAREKFPMLKESGLKGGLVYYDGQVRHCAEQ